MRARKPRGYFLRLTRIGAIGFCAAALLFIIGWSSTNSLAASGSVTAWSYPENKFNSAIVVVPGDVGGTAGAASSAPTMNTPNDTHWAGKLPIKDLNEEEAITHALNRLGYGPRPGDIERVERMGLENWIQKQLHPETIDDAGTEARLTEYPTIAMPSATLINEYPRPNVAAQRMKITVEEYNKREQDMLHPAQGVRPAEDRRPQTIVNELTMAKLVRAVYSERQLQEQLDDFWFNHFNIFAQKDDDIYMITSFERDAIRPNLFAKFRDLLGATAHSPAMLIYLDNWLSADPTAVQRAQHATPDQKRAWKDLPPLGNKKGLNENYGREIMELHTLGVDGGYTQQDVIEVAKCFTGWTIRAPQTKPEFVFDPRLHTAEPKKVLGKKIKDGGVRDGEKVMDLLASQKATAHHISYQLAEHFLSDTPPPALVDRMEKSFEKSKGDLREVVRTMIYSPEFWSRDAYRAKIKTPFELVASAARALGAEVDSPTPLVQWVANIGEPLYQYQAPTGYKDNAETWVNTNGLLKRLNFAMTLAGNRVRGTSVDLTSRLGDDCGNDPMLALDRAVETFVGEQMSAGTRTTLESKLNDPQITHARLDDPVHQVDLGVITGLVLGTPEFQRR
jgi:uncharacterized protein (DUF1800 family)